MLRKLFGRKKKGEDDEDDEFDEDLEDEDFDDDDFDSDDMETDAGGAEDGDADDGDAVSGDDTMADPEGDSGADAAGDTDAESGDADEIDANTDEPDGEPEGDDDFGDDDEDFDDDDEYDDEDDEDEEEGRFGVIWGNTWARIAIITLSILLVFGAVGIGGWMFISSGVEEEIARQAAEEAQQNAASGGGLQPSSQSLNNLQVEEDTAQQFLPPPETSVESVGGEQLAGTQATSGLGSSGGLNAIGAGGGTGGLNTIGAGGSGGLNAAAGGALSTPGAGVVVPVSTASSYSQFPDYPTNDSLPKAPTSDLLELRDNELPLPRTAFDGRVSWREYARPSEVAADRKRVALIVSGLGLSRAATLSAISKLPSPVSLSFSPYAEELEQWMIRSRRAGHEVILGLPLESNRFPVQDPGPLALLTILPDDENQLRLETVLSSQQGYIGVEVMMGTKYTADEFRVRDLLTQLNERGLMVIDGAWNNRSLIPRVAAELAMPRVITSVRLDGVMAKAAIDAKLRELDTVVETRGSGVGATTVTPAILERLLVWISSLPGKNVELVPVSALTSTQAAQTAEEQQ